MTKAEVIEWLEKYVECKLVNDRDCLKTNCDECSHNFDACKEMEVLATAIDLLKMRKYEEDTDELRKKISKDIEYFTEKVKSQVYDLVLEVAKFAERIKSND